MATGLLIIHGLVAVALLGAITHQTMAAWASPSARPRSFLGRFSAVPSASFANAIVVLYTVSALLGGIVYLYFRVDIRPDLERAGHWQALGFFDQVCAAAEKVLAGANVTRMQLEAFKYYYVPGKGIGLAGIVVKPTPALLKLQQELISAVAPFTVETGTMAAFTAPHDDPALDAILIEYVSNIRSETGRRAFQSARQHRGRPPGLPRQNARRTV